MTRRKLVAGNWKMNSGPGSDDLRAIDEVANRATVDVALCPPATMIQQVHAIAPNVWIGGQDCHAAESGAFTGWLSAEMVRNAGAAMVIVGHSERRALAGETDGDVRGKAEAALRAGLLPIICVGESEQQRASGNHVATVLAQIDASVPAASDERVIVAYEPVWAIGTGKVATTGNIAEMHAAVRNRLRANHGAFGDAIRILYGGSVKASNAGEIFAVEDVDGALVGGASLTATDFLPIVEAAIAAG